MDMYDWGPDAFGMETFDLHTFDMGVGFGELGEMNGFASSADWDTFLNEMSEFSHDPSDLFELPPGIAGLVVLFDEGGGDASNDGGLFEDVGLWFAPIIIGPLVGGALGFLDGVITEMRDGDGNFDWGNVLNDTLRGALSGAFGGAYVQGGKIVGNKFVEYYVGPIVGQMMYLVFEPGSIPACKPGDACG